MRVITLLFLFPGLAMSASGQSLKSPSGTSDTTAVSQVAKSERWPDGRFVDVDGDGIHDAVTARAAGRDRTRERRVRGGLRRRQGMGMKGSSDDPAAPGTGGLDCGCSIPAAGGGN